MSYIRALVVCLFVCLFLFCFVFLDIVLSKTLKIRVLIRGIKVESFSFAKLIFEWKTSICVWVYYFEKYVLLLNTEEAYQNRFHVVNATSVLVIRDSQTFTVHCKHIHLKKTEYDAVVYSFTDFRIY